MSALSGHELKQAGLRARAATRRAHTFSRAQRDGGECFAPLISTPGVARMCSGAPGTSEKELLKNAPGSPQTQIFINFESLVSPASAIGSSR